MDFPVSLSFIAVASNHDPPLMEAHLMKKIKTIFQIALLNGHDSIVLSAFGCGVPFGFHNPHHIAYLFKYAIITSFNGCFKKIVFAIIEDENSIGESNPEGNLQPFVKAMSLL